MWNRLKAVILHVIGGGGSRLSMLVRRTREPGMKHSPHASEIVLQQRLVWRENTVQVAGEDGERVELSWQKPPLRELTSTNSTTPNVLFLYSRSFLFKSWGLAAVWDHPRKRKTFSWSKSSSWLYFMNSDTRWWDMQHTEQIYTLWCSRCLCSPLLCKYVCELQS